MRMCKLFVFAPTLLLVASLALPMADSLAASDKKVDVVFPIKLVVSQPLTASAEGSLSEEYQKWFQPFGGGTVCPNMQGFPNLEGVRADLQGSKPVKLIESDPKELRKTLVSGLQNMIGVKPKFPAMQAEMTKRIAGVSAPKELNASAVAAKGQVADSALNEAVAALGTDTAILVIASKKKEAGEQLKGVLAKQMPGKEKLMLVVSGPEEFHAALSKHYCGVTGNQKEKGPHQAQAMVLLDEGAFFTVKVANGPGGGQISTSTTGTNITPPGTTVAPQDPAAAQRHLDMAVMFLSQARDNPALQQTHLREAVKELDAAILADPNLGLAYLNRGAAALALNELKTAEPDFRRAETLLPEQYGPPISLAFLYGRQGKNDATLAELDKAFTKGYKRVDDLRREKDLAGVVRLPEFEALLRKHKFIN